MPFCDVAEYEHGVRHRWAVTTDPYVRAFVTLCAARRSKPRRADASKSITFTRGYRSSVSLWYDLYIHRVSYRHKPIIIRIRGV
jgi:hypothetical protein